MKKQARGFAAMVALALAGALAPGSSSAQHCSDQIVIFSRPVAVNSNAFSCEVFSHDADGRIINPGSTGVSIRYTQDYPGRNTLIATLNGLGFVDKKVTLTRGTTDLGGIVYDSGTHVIPDGRLGSGCITAVIEYEEDEFYSATGYHTVGSSCPDFP